MLKQWEILFCGIGKGGSKIRELQDNSGARIKVGYISIIKWMHV